jgi:ATP-dependent Zn protease
MLSKHRALLDKVSSVLLDKETIDEKEFKEIVSSEVYSGAAA